MSEHSHIEWCDAAWPVTTGCDYDSAGCINCYAVPASYRMAHNPNPKVSEPYAGTVERRNGKLRWTGLVKCHPERLDWPLKWRKPSRIFVGSMSDLFHQAVPDEFILAVFDVMRRCTWAGGQDCGRIGGNGHTFQVLTKRTERMADFCSRLRWDGEHLILDSDGRYPLAMTLNRDIWLGTSVENQATADRRIPHLMRAPARVRYVSAEPLLGPVDLTRLDNGGGETFDALTARVTTHRGHSFVASDVEPLSWVIGGGESGPGARPCDLAWIRSIVAQCKDAGVACFVKQLGARPFDGYRPSPYPPSLLGPAALKEDRDELGLADRKGGDPAEWPECLRVRQFPAAVAP